MTHYGKLADLTFTVDRHSLQLHEQDTGSMTRVTTELTLQGDGVEGRGEDVTYEASHHHAVVEADPFDLTGTYTIAEFATHLDGIDLFHGRTLDREDYRNYRRWMLESAALDLALRQHDTDLATALGRDYAPVRFVASMSLDDPPSTENLERWRAIHPDLGFKLDANPGWDTAFIVDLAAMDCVDVVDMKAFYDEDSVGEPADPALYTRVRDGLPDVVIEDAKVTAETRNVLEPARERLSWDKPVVDVDSIEALPFEPRWINIKPSRFGRLETLLDTITYCREHDIAMYGGGQYELGIGRAQLHALASLFYPDAPNDVAPLPYHAPEPRQDAPGSPLTPQGEQDGFGWRFREGP